MFGSSILDIAVGVVFVFLLLSLIASTLNEMILSFLNMRGKELLRGLRTLLNDDKAEGLVKKIYTHGLVYGLYQGEFDPRKQGNLPSYIPPRVFAGALIDIVAPSAETLRDEKAMLDSLRAEAQKLAKDDTTAKVGRPLLAMLDEAGTDAEKLKQSIQDWYNSAMDRVSGWYKYRTQWMLLLLGIVLALGLNVDTVVVARHLANDSALRQSLVAAAEETAKKPAATSPGNTNLTETPSAAIADNINRLQTLGLPIGWLSPTQLQKPDGSSGDAEFRVWPGFRRFPGVIQYHFWGWLLTAVAISMGAPFWFDMLNKIMVVRSTVKPREKSQEEQSKDE